MLKQNDLHFLEPVQDSNDNSDNPAVDVEQLFAENGDSSTMGLCELSEENMIIAASKLRDHEVRRSVVHMKNNEIGYRKHAFFAHAWFSTIF